MAKTLYGKKKTVRNILIGVIAALVIAAAIFLIIALQKDGAGMNCFQRNATAATADGERATMSEYRVTLDMIASNYSNTTLGDDSVRSLQQNAARQVLMQKIYVKEAKKLGLSLTDEQKTACSNSADQQLSAVEEYYTQSLISGGSYSKAALDKQVAAYYQNLGMTKDAYRSFLLLGMEAEYYRQAIEAYYAEKGSGIAEEDLINFYRKSVEETMTTTDADGNKVSTYSDGAFWNTLMLYQIGYSSSPVLFVPEGFIYVDFIELQKGTEEEINQIVTEVKNGDRSFDELKASDENVDTFKNFLNGAYPIAEKDHSSLFSEEEAYAVAAALEPGQIDAFVGSPKTSEDGTTTVTAYLFRRAEGNICYEGDHGVIDIDYFNGLRTIAQNEYRMDGWLSDVKYEDAIFAYRGSLK